ncbi:MAG TPA: hypothetical protein VGM80_00405 [Gaiellaceae bacterium]
MAESGAGAATVRRGPRFARIAPWAALVLGVLIFYWVEASLRKGPWLFSDELEWSQLSRSIATTGHAARRTAPNSFESLYSYLIAPAWWIHSTNSAYAAIKYLDSLVMCLTAVPVYLLSRLLVSRRTAVVVALLSIAIPSMAYSTFIVPESLAYLWFTATALASIRALARPGVRAAVPAVLLSACGPLIRSEFVILPVALVVAAVILWILRGGASALQVRRIAAAAGALALFGYLFNRFVVMRVQTWNTGQYFNHHTLGQGSVAAGALAIGLGMGPVVGGLASLHLPDRRSEPAYRAFVAYLGSVTAVCLVYTAAKATYLIANLGDLIEERNLFFLSPLLLLGTALVLEARRVDWYLLGAACVGVVAVVWSNRLEVGAPYYEAPGLAVPTLLNRNFVFTVADIHAVLIGATAITVALILCRTRRWTGTIAAVLACAWLLTGEIYFTRTSDQTASLYATKLAAPHTWIDAHTGRAPTTFLGGGVPLQDAGPVWLTEFWNRSIDHVFAVDDSAPPPGPIAAPYFLSIDGRLADYTGDRYTVAGAGIVLDAPVVAVNPPFTLYSTPTPWRVESEVHNITGDGWGLNPFRYSYFPRGGPGVIKVELSRTGYNNPAAPPGRATIEVGTVKLDSNGDPAFGRVVSIIHAMVPNGGKVVVPVHVASTPATVSVTVTPTIEGDPRQLAAQPSFSFDRDH